MSSVKGTVTTTRSTPSALTYNSRNIKLHNTLSLQLQMPQKSAHLKKNIIAYEGDVRPKRTSYLIFEKGINFTPKPLRDPSYASYDKKQLGTMKSRVAGRPDRRDLESMLSSVHTLQSRYSMKVSKGSMAPTMVSSSFASLGNLSWLSLSPTLVDEEEEEIEIGLLHELKPPSLFRLREDPPPRESKVNTVFTIHLEETETMFMLNIPAGAVPYKSEEGKVISETNAEYDKKLRASKSISHTATQTRIITKKHCKAFAPKNTRNNTGVLATTWDIYDTYQEEEHRSASLRSSAGHREEGQVAAIEQPAVLDEVDASEEFEYLGCNSGKRLLNALMVMERLLEKKYYREEQLLYQGLLLENPLSLDFKCNYTLRHLWTFESESTKNRSVTSMCWSPKIPNILAVGYGKFQYMDNCAGLVCIWNVKNPKFPERQFQFEDPVTCVAFSELRSQILAVSFYNGLVLLLDIVSRTQVIKASNDHYPLYYPVWQIRWFPSEGPVQVLVTSGKNGRVYSYKKSKFFTSRKLMSMNRPHGKIQGVEQPTKCFPRKTLTNRHPSAEVLACHPTEPLTYLVGTAEGYVYICSVQHRHDHIETFLAHDGPVYSIQFNPYCDKVLLTCGADCCVRIWAEGIFEPLVTLESGMVVVQDALWDPLRSTVIVSASETSIEIWDIRRRMTTPKSSTESPTKSFTTVLQFSENKYNLCIGDSDGNVHIMALTEMPFSPSFQDEILAQSIINILVTRPDLVQKLQRLGHPFRPSRSRRKAAFVI